MVDYLGERLLTLIFSAKKGMYIPPYDSPVIQNSFCEYPINLSYHFYSDKKLVSAVFSSEKL